MSAETRCREILAELSKHKDSDRDTVFIDCVKDRMGKCLDTYREEMETAYRYLTEKNEMRMMRRLNRR